MYQYSTHDWGKKIKMIKTCQNHAIQFINLLNKNIQPKKTAVQKKNKIKLHTLRLT
jgi:hypothetical protein